MSAKAQVPVVEIPQAEFTNLNAESKQYKKRKRSLDAEFEKKVKVLAAEYRQKRVELQRSFIKKLEPEKLARTKSGDLDSAIEIRDAIDAVEKEEAIVPFVFRDDEDRSNLELASQQNAPLFGTVWEIAGTNQKIVFDGKNTWIENSRWVWTERGRYDDYILLEDVRRGIWARIYSTAFFHGGAKDRWTMKKGGWKPE